MIRFLERAIARVFIWWCIPLRILKELYLCLADSSKPTTEEVVHEPVSNGNGHAHTNGKDSSVDQTQKKLWQDQAAQDHWWGENSPLAMLRTLNPVRVRLVAEAYLKDVLGLEATWEQNIVSDAKFLSGARICDVGCGGGILSEALADVGATVTGIDIIPAAIGIAKRHWVETGHSKEDSSTIAPEYLCKSLESLTEERAGTFDVVICSEVLEHVVDPESFARRCCTLVRPGGCVIFTTVNRTIWSLFGLIIVPEDVLGLLPRFCHRLHKCVKPEQIEDALRMKEFNVIKTVGLIPLPQGLRLRELKWMTSTFTGMNYAVVAKRPE